MNESTTQKSHTRFYQRRWFKITASLFALVLIGLTITAEYLLHNASPILRKRVIETLSARFNAPVELDTLDISLLRGVEVTGTGLRIPYGTDAASRMPLASGDKSHVFLSIDHFTFRSTLSELLHSPTNIGVVYVDNVTIDLPPGPDRSNLLHTQQPADPEHPKTQPKIAIIVGEIRCKNAKLILEPKDPIKAPKEFDINSLILHKMSGALEYLYEAQLINPIPRGQIVANGHIGPWNIDQPRQSPIDGIFSFSNADMNTIKGIGGTLNATGKFNGVLERLTVDGTADVPDFSLDISNHPVPLHTQYHAFVDATSGDTTLSPVTARLGHSDFTCAGTVMHIKGKGHDIALDVNMPHGRIEDLIELGMKSSPPLMTGIVTMKTKLHIPPGKVRVVRKLELAGALTINNVQFTKSEFQDKIDGLSMRAQGKPQDAKTASTDHKDEVHSTLATDFSLKSGEMTFHSIRYQVPGALVLLDGVDSLDGNLFEFKGHVRTDAKPSQMVTGWKSKLLKPIDPFLKRNGAGMELPISISGQKNDVHLGLAFGKADESTADMSKDLKAKRADAPPPKKK